MLQLPYAVRLYVKEDFIVLISLCFDEILKGKCKLQLTLKTKVGKK